MAPNTVGRSEPGFESPGQPDLGLPSPATSNQMGLPNPPITESSGRDLDSAWMPTSHPRGLYLGALATPRPDVTPLPCSRLSLSLCEMGQAHHSVLPAPAPHTHNCKAPINHLWAFKGLLCLQPRFSLHFDKLLANPVIDEQERRGCGAEQFFLGIASGCTLNFKLISCVQAQH